MRNFIISKSLWKFWVTNGNKTEKWDKPRGEISAVVNSMFSGNTTEQFLPSISCSAANMGQARPRSSLERETVLQVVQTQKGGSNTRTDAKRWQERVSTEHSEKYTSVLRVWFLAFIVPLLKIIVFFSGFFAVGWNSPTCYCVLFTVFLYVSKTRFKNVMNNIFTQLNLLFLW